MVKVYAKFDKILDAKNAVEVLKSMGYKNAHIDIADKFHAEFSSELGTSTKKATCLSDIFLNSKGKVYNIDKAPLLASDPIISGNGTYDIMINANVHLQVNVEEKQIQELEKALTELGGIKI